MNSRDLISQTVRVALPRGGVPPISCVDIQEIHHGQKTFFSKYGPGVNRCVGGLRHPGHCPTASENAFHDVPQVYIPIVGSDEMFPVRRTYCIGRNYAAHAREMGSDPTREPPFFFQKPTDAIQ